MKTARKNGMRGKTRSTRHARKSIFRRKGLNAQKIRTFLVRSWWVLRGAAAGALVLVILYGGYLGVDKMIVSSYLAVKDIQVSGCIQIEPERLINLSGVRPGEPLVRVDIMSVRQRLLTHPVVKDVSVVRELPDTLRILVVERMPAAAVLGGGFAIVDGEGVVLSREDVFSGEFPVITGIENIPSPGVVADEAVFALEVIEEMVSSGFPERERISEVRINNQRLLVFLTGSGTMLVFPRRNVSGALERLKRFIQAGVFDSAAPGYDLRFEGRVVALPESTVKKESPGKNSFAGG